MNINELNKDVHTVYIDRNTTLLIVARRDEEDKIVCQAEFRNQLCRIRYFNNVTELFDHYHITNREFQDCILRVIDFIDGKL
jgi:hypothetical protein